MFYPPKVRRKKSAVTRLLRFSQAVASNRAERATSARSFSDGRFQRAGRVQLHKFMHLKCNEVAAKLSLVPPGDRAGPVVKHIRAENLIKQNIYGAVFFFIGASAGRSGRRTGFPYLKGRYCDNVTIHRRLGVRKRTGFRARGDGAVGEDCKTVSAEETVDLAKTSPLKLTFSTGMRG